MPAFSFEKISPPVRRAPVIPQPKKPRGIIVQMIGRLFEGRIKRGAREEQSDGGQQPSD